jgi:predicted acetyltransferase
MKIKKLNSYRDSVFSDLQQQYELEFAPITGYKPGADGKFDIYLLYLNECPSGFAVINLSSMINDDTDVRDIAEFFVISQQRNQGWGLEFAQRIFKKYPGKWQVRQLINLHKARRFWLKAIAVISPSDFQEEVNPPGWQGYLQSFTL